jgi:hypothetical protein
MPSRFVRYSLDRFTRHASGGLAHWRDRITDDAISALVRSNMRITLEVGGWITNSSHLEHFVRVQDDRAQSGGFLIHEHWLGSKGPGPNGAFDSWVEDEVALTRFFAEAGWVVEWNRS